MAREKSTAGECPYCRGTGFVFVKERRPQQLVERCGSVACGKYSMRSERTGARYPLMQPTDSNSDPRV